MTAPDCWNCGKPAIHRRWVRAVQLCGCGAWSDRRPVLMRLEVIRELVGSDGQHYAITIGRQVHRSGIVVLACGAKKAAAPAPALELYTGSYFAAALRWARSVCLPRDLFVISAEHGLIPGDRVIEPYERRMTPARAAELGGLVVAQARALGLAEARPVFYAGGAGYLELLRAAIPGVAAVSSCLPAGRAGRGIGAQLSWYRRNHGRGLLELEEATAA